MVTVWDEYLEKMIEEILEVDNNPEHIEYVGDIDGHLFVMHSLARRSDIASIQKTKKIDKIVDKYTNILIREGLHRND